jgi:hypothetical protein
MAIAEATDRRDPATVARNIYDELGRLDDKLNSFDANPNVPPSMRRERRSEIFKERAGLVWGLLDLRGASGITFETILYKIPGENLHLLSTNHLRVTAWDSQGTRIGSARTTLYQLAESAEIADVNEMTRARINPDVEKEEALTEYPHKVFTEIRMAEREYRDRRDWNDQRGMRRFSELRDQLIESALTIRGKFPEVLRERITADHIPGRSGNAITIGFRDPEEIGVQKRPENFVTVDWTPELDQLIEEGGGYNFIHPKILEDEKSQIRLIV